ncbi:MAG: DNA topoisomerase IV subunit A, partial [Candidatus Bathyarchaeia archaeon]
MESKEFRSIMERRKEVLSSLENFGAKIYAQIDRGYFPSIEMPSRSTENIYYDPKFRQFILG